MTESQPTINSQKITRPLRGQHLPEGTRFQVTEDGPTYTAGEKMMYMTERGEQRICTIWGIAKGLLPRLLVRFEHHPIQQETRRSIGRALSSTSLDAGRNRIAASISIRMTGNDLDGWQLNFKNDECVRTLKLPYRQSEMITDAHGQQWKFIGATQSSITVVPNGHSNIKQNYQQFTGAALLRFIPAPQQTNVNQAAE